MGQKGGSGPSGPPPPPPGSAHACIDIYGRSDSLIGPTNQACRPIQHLQLGGGGKLDKTELCSQIIEYKIILVGPYKYYERKGVLVDIITIKTKRGAEDTGAGRAGGGPSPQLFMQKSSDLHTPPPPGPTSSARPALWSRSLIQTH